MSVKLLQEWMSLIDFKITEGYDYMWDCYGDSAHGLDSDDFLSGQKYSVGIIFDKQTQLVYELTSYDYDNNVANRWINPYYKNKHDASAEKAPGSSAAWDDVLFTESETSTEFFNITTTLLNQYR